jgi:hypothetical protein
MYEAYGAASPMNNPLSQVGQVNPYAQDANSSAGAPFYNNNNTFQQPPQYHLYTSLAPHRENLQPYQRAQHDFFMSDKLREELQRKSAAALQVLPSEFLLLQLMRFANSSKTRPFLPRSIAFIRWCLWTPATRKTRLCLDIPVGSTRSCRARMARFMPFAGWKVIIRFASWK